MKPNACKKVQFANEAFALAHLKRLNETALYPKKTTATYLCEECGFWHLTTMNRDEFDEVKMLKTKINNLQKTITHLNGVIAERNKKIRELKDKLLPPYHISKRNLHNG